MTDNTLPTNQIPPIESPPSTTERPLEMAEQRPFQEETSLEEGIEEELIIEDFTIDGICGVY